MRRASALLVAAAVAAAFADSSIVVLALPDLYGSLDTSIVGVSLVVTAYNAAVAVAALALLPAARRLDAGRSLRAGVVLFALASAGCAAAWSLEALVAFRVLQGVGGALLLAAALPLLARPAGGGRKGASLWTAAGAAGAACGPALGGVLTQLADWRAIFAAQAPVALCALARASTGQTRGEGEGHVTTCHKEGGGGVRQGWGAAAAANAALALLFGGLVGALFLAVLLLVTAWSLEPLEGALVVSALPVSALAVRRPAGALPARQAACGGALLLALGLLALALLPGASEGLAAAALAVCGCGLGLALPVLSRTAVAGGSIRAGLATVACRHAGLVLALALVAPLLAHALDRDGRRALLAGTRVVLDGDVSLFKKVPIALDLRDALEEAPRGEVPDLARPFDRHGAGSDERVRRLRDELVATLQGVLTRSFRGAFVVAALLALLASVPALRLGRAR